MEEAVLGREEGPIWGESGQMGPLGLAYDVGVPAPVPGGRRDSRSHFLPGGVEGGVAFFFGPAKASLLKAPAAGKG